MRWGTVEENELIAKEMHITASPTRGSHRVQPVEMRQKPIKNGAVRYMMPMAQVPITAMFGDPANGSCVV
jgi:hypothetical protein